MHPCIRVQSYEVHIGPDLRSVVLGAGRCAQDTWESAHVNFVMHLIRFDAHMHTLLCNLVQHISAFMQYVWCWVQMGASRTSRVCMSILRVF
jgi:hypothetical protein